MERKLALIGALVALILQAPLWGGSPRQVVGFSFDWDDNLIFMPTTIVVFHKTTGAEKEITTAQWAEIRKLVGQAGTQWADYEVRQDLATGSFRYFADSYDPEILAKHVDKAMQSGDWQAPSWPAFLQAMHFWKTARQTTIITARGHKAVTVRNVLLRLRDRGLIEYVPPEKNIYTVSGAQDPSAAKVAVMKEILERIQARGTDETFVPVLNREGTARAPLHLWGFSDDDWGNFSKAAAALGEEVAKGRWSHIKITLFYTHKENPPGEVRLAPGAYVLRSDGSLRPVLPGELDEVSAVIGDEACGPGILAE